MSYVYDYHDSRGGAYEIEFDTQSEMMRFEHGIERFFSVTGIYPPDLHQFFVGHQFNPIAVNDGGLTSHRRGTDTMAFRNQDKYGMSYVDVDPWGRSSAEQESRRIDQERRESRRREQASDLVPTNSIDQVRDLLTSVGALPANKPLNQMTNAERARATATGLAQLVQLAAAELATATAAEQARGEEPPVGSTVRFAKHFGGSNTKQYNFAATRVEKGANSVDPHRGWHHTGATAPVRLSTHLPNPCSWEELNEFADEGSVEVGMDWAKGPDWKSWVAGEGSGLVDGEGSTNERIVTVLHAGITEAQRVLRPMAHPGASVGKRDLKAAVKKLDEALKAHDDLVVEASEKDEAASS